MMRITKLLACSMAFAIVSNGVYAQSVDKSQNCPDVRQIQIKMLSENHHILEAINNDGKYFASNLMMHTDSNGPAIPVKLINATYNSIDKTLSCNYLAFDGINPTPVLINHGDY